MEKFKIVNVHLSSSLHNLILKDAKEFDMKLKDYIPFLLESITFDRELLKIIKEKNTRPS